VSCAADNAVDHRLDVALRQRRYGVRRLLRPSSSCGAPLRKLRPCRARPRSAAKRSSCRSRSSGRLSIVKGHAAPGTKAAAERAQKLLEKAEALGEPPEDPLLLFSVLYNLWGASFSNFEAARDLAAQFLTFAERQRSTTPRMIGHRMMGTSLIWLGRISEGMVHLDQALKLYEPTAHRALGPRFA
jgi:hypothetical protein